MNPWSRALNGCGAQDEPVPEAQKMALNVPGGLPREYPREFEQEITLEDGTRVRIRPVLPEDETRLVTPLWSVEPARCVPALLYRHETAPPGLGPLFRQRGLSPANGAGGGTRSGVEAGVDRRGQV